jgi:hypothetical protein
MSSKPCPPGCTCGRHSQPGGQPCAEGCACKKHTNSGYGGGRAPTLFVTVGQRIGRGLVIDPEVRAADGTRAARLRCDCGNEYVAVLKMLIRRDGVGRIRSCGCLLREVMNSPRKHGLTHHPFYRTWHMMLWRCENPAAKDYHRYGGRGVTVCDRWHDVTLFIEDIERDLGPRPDGMTLDRADNDGNYEPGNVRWATRKEQIANSRPRRKRLAVTSG